MELALKEDLGDMLGSAIQAPTWQQQESLVKEFVSLLDEAIDAAVRGSLTKELGSVAPEVEGVESVADCPFCGETHVPRVTTFSTPRGHRWQAQINCADGCINVSCDGLTEEEALGNLLTTWNKRVPHV